MGKQERIFASDQEQAVASEVAQLVARSRNAQRQIEDYTQEQVDELIIELEEVRQRVPGTSGSRNG